MRSGSGGLAGAPKRAARRLRGAVVASPRSRAGLHAAAGRRLRRVLDRPLHEGDDPRSVLRPVDKHVRRLWLDTLPARSVEPPVSGPVPVDLLVPVGPNDVDVVARCVSGAHAHLLDPVRSTTILCPRALVDAIRREVVDEGVAVRDEADVLPEGAEAALSRLPAWRRGWYRQQLVKLAWAAACDGAAALTLDADTILVRPQRVCTDAGIAFFVAADEHRPYFDALARLLPGTFTWPIVGTTAHQVLYEPVRVRACLAAIEAAHPGRTWAEAIVDVIDPTESSGFAETELYGQWMLRCHRDDVALHAFSNLERPRAGAPTSLAELVAEHGADVDSVSLHYWVERAVVMRSGGSW